MRATRAARGMGPPRASVQGGPAGRSPPDSNRRARERERAQRCEPRERRGAWGPRERACRGDRRGEAPRTKMTRKFDIITEADARQIEVGATVELAKGGHVTPLAKDTIRERRVTVVPAGSVDPALPPDLAPRSEIRRVAIASDHTGVKMRAAIVQHL